MLSNLLRLLIVCSFYAEVVANFTTLRDAAVYAAQHEETPPVTKKSWRDPDYTGYLHAITPGVVEGFIKRRLWNWHIVKRPIWTPDDFQHTLQQLIEQRKDIPKNGLLFLKTDPLSKIYVWGDLHAAFHAFVRELEYLEKNGVIDNNFVIQQENTYMVVLGDAISRSAYSMEMLTLVGRLMEKNPEKFFYLAGNHESFGYWRNFGLDNELRIRARYIAWYDKPPLGDLVDRFFETLPKVMYVNIAGDDSNSVLRLSHMGRDEGFDERDLGDFAIGEVPTGITYIAQPEKAKTEHPLNVPVIVRGEARTDVAASTKGLEILDPDRGAISWAVLSASTPIYREFFDFHYDSFVLITLGKQLIQSIITLIARDSRNKDSVFEKLTSFELVSGQSTGHDLEFKEQKKPLEFGSSLSLSHNIRLIGQQIKRGLSTAVLHQNSEGGIEGRPIHITFLDDQYLPLLARKNVETLLSQGVDILITPVGTPTFEAYKDFVQTGTLAVFFPQAAGQTFEGQIPGLINLRASYSEEARALVEYMYNVRGSRLFTFFYQNDSYGLGALEAAHETLKALGITKWIDIPYVRGQIDLRQQATELINSRPDVICLFSTGSITQELLKLVSLQSIAQCSICALSPLNETSFRYLLQQLGLKATFGQAMPDPARSDMPLVKEYRATMDRLGFGYDTISLQGFVSGALFIDLLQKANGDFSKKHLLSLAEQLVDFNFKGFEFSFNPATRSLAKYVWIEPADGEHWIQVPIVRPAESSPQPAPAFPIALTNKTDEVLQNSVPVQ